MRRHVAALANGRRVLTRTLLGAAAALLVVAAAAWWTQLEPPAARAGSTPTPKAAGSEGAQPTAGVAEPVVPARRAASVIRPERPLTARLPSGTLVPIRPVSTGANGVLAVPHDIRSAGWWRGGARLGDPFGSTLLAAHVDSATQGLGPYVELLTVRPGQPIVLTSASLRQTFAVRSLRLVRQGPLTSMPAIYAANGERRLTLVTCAPPFVKKRGGYQNLVVVTATPITEPLPRAR